MNELSRRERKKRETQEKLFTSAIDLFKSRGFNNTSIEDITKNADLGKGTFYNYYSSKEAVVLEFSKRKFDKLGGGVEGGFSFTEKISYLLKEWAIFMVNEREIASITLRSSWENDLDSDLHRRLKAIIAAGQREGEISSEFDTSFLAQSLEGMVIKNFMHWYITKNENIFEEIQNIIDVFLGELLVKKA